MKLANAIWFSLLLFLLVIVAGVIWVMTSGYNELIDFAMQQLQRPDLRTMIEGRYFTLDKYNRLQRAGFSALPVLLALVGLLFIKRKNAVSIIDSVFTQGKKFLLSIKDGIKSSDKPIRITMLVLLVLVLLRSVYYALHYYPQYDECWNYNYFLSNNFFTTIFASNNYPLHNIVTLLFLKVLPDSTFIMRLPNILLGSINLILIFHLCKKVFNHDILSVTAVGIFAVLPTAVFYMLFARGVMLALLFALLILYYFILKPITIWSKTDQITLSILGALGCYSMISFPLFLIMLFIIYGLQGILKKDGTAIKKLVWTTVGIVIGAGLLYLPMFLGSGLSLVANSTYGVASFNWNEYLDATLKVSRDQIGFYYGAYTFIAFNVLLLFLSNRKKIMVLNILLLLLPYIIPLLLKTYLPARALGFQAIAYLFTLLLIFEYLFQKFNIAVILVTSIFTIIGFNYISTTHTFFDWSARPDKGVYEIAQLMQKEGITSYYDFDGRFAYFVPGILYHHKIQGKQIAYKTSNKNSARYLPIEEYMGDVYVANFAYLHPKEIGETIYRYQDESNQFILFRRATQTQRADSLKNELGN